MGSGSGRLTQVTTASGVSDSGTITYTYYADGMRKSLGLSLPGASFNKLNLFQYNYRADGLRSSLLVSNVAQATFAWTYTNAEREMQEIDPLNGTSGGGVVTYVPLSYSYDAYGRIASETLPRGFTYSNFAYDIDGGNLSWNSNQTLSQQISYSLRNEVTNTTVSPSTGPGAAVVAYNRFANGAQYTAQADSGRPRCTFDSRSSVLRSWVDPGMPAVIAATNTSPAYNLTYQTNHNFVYDTAGRETQDQVNNCSVTASNDPGIPVAQAPTIISVRTYDAENHITSQTLPATYEPGSNCFGAQPSYTQNESRAYAWGPDAHLAQWSDTATSTTNVTLGWDGDDLLYMANGAGVTATAAQADEMGSQWVGKGATVSRSGNAISATGNDGITRTFRPGTLKENGVGAGKVQANFEWRTSPGGKPVGNGHLTINK